MITHPQSEVTIFEVQLVRVTVIMEVLRPMQGDHDGGVEAQGDHAEVLKPRVIVIMRTACMPHGAVAHTCMRLAPRLETGGRVPCFRLDRSASENCMIVPAMNTHTYRARLAAKIHGTTALVQHVAISAAQTHL